MKLLASPISFSLQTYTKNALIDAVEDHRLHKSGSETLPTPRWMNNEAVDLNHIHHFIPDPHRLRHRGAETNELTRRLHTETSPRYA